MTTHPDLPGLDAFQNESAYRQGQASFLKPFTPARRPGRTDIPLPHPAPQPGLTLTEVLTHRQSWRLYSTQPLPLPTLGTLLAGATHHPDPAHRAYPSAGALHPVQLHVIACRVPDLPAGAYRYAPETHSLEVTPPAQGGPAWSHAIHGSGPELDRAAAFLVLTGDLSNTVAKYGARGLRFTYQESGHLAQNVTLLATSLGLGSLCIGSFYDDLLTTHLALPAHEVPLYVIALGWPEPVEAAEALLLYRQAAAQRTLTATWRQWRLASPTPVRLAAALQPGLRALRRDGLILSAWHLFKADGGPHVRLRVEAAPGADSAMDARMGELFCTFTPDLLVQAQSTRYDPETSLFGGPAGLTLTHRWFHLDAQLSAAATRLSASHQDQASLLWLTLTLRGAGLDDFERWDVWRKVSALRAVDPATYLPLVQRFEPVAQRVSAASTDDLRRTLHALIPDVGDVVHDPSCAEAFAQAARAGHLDRSARDVLATWIIFHFNRMGMTLPRQAFLALLMTQATAP